MSSFETETSPKEKGTIKYFERSRTIAMYVSMLALAGFLLIVYLTVPFFFTNFWLGILLLVTLVATKSYGSWDAYAKMRKQTDRMQEELNSIAKAVEKEKTHV